MKTTSIITIILCALLSNCIIDKLDSRNITVINNSKDTIYSIISPSDDMFGSGYYDEFKQGSDYQYTPAAFKMEFSPIAPFDQVEPHDRPRFWDNYFKEHDKMVRVFIVKKGTVNKSGWHKIFNESQYDEKYLLSEKQLDSCSWKINYRN